MRIAKEFVATYKVPKDLGGGEIELVYLNQGAEQQLMEDTNDLYIEYLKGEASPKLKPKGVLFRELGVIRKVRSWKNFFDKDGTPLECNDVNKVLFSAENGFMKMFDEFYLKHKDLAEKELEKERKNSKSSPGGSAE